MKKKSKAVILIAVISLGLGGCQIKDNTSLSMRFTTFLNQVYLNVLTQITETQQMNDPDAGKKDFDGPIQADDVFDLSEELSDDQTFGGMAPGGTNQFPNLEGSSSQSEGEKATGESEFTGSGEQGMSHLTPEGDVFEG